MKNRSCSSSDGFGTEHKELFAFLNDGAGGRNRADRIIETHAAQIFLIGEYAFKIKKPVNLGYLDFSTLEKRHQALDRELERNRRSAPEFYLRLATIRRAPTGELQLGDEGPVVDYVLIMRRFADGTLLSDNVDLVCGEFAEALGRTIAGYHADAPIERDAWPAGLTYALETNVKQLSQFESVLGANEVQALIANTTNAFELRRSDIEKRANGGFVRQCHGDLHLKNIFLSDKKPVLFDCIEFDDRLSKIDVLYDLAFLVMDLLHADQMEGANRLVNGYFDQAQRSFDEANWAGLVLFPLYLSMRACVRAHVSARMEREKDARLYLREALDHLRQTEPSLISVGGLSGTGKTTFARALAPSVGCAPGAIVLRSDEIRKRLWGVAPLERLPTAAYTKEASGRVYETMFQEAHQILHAGCAVILDAVFLSPEERDRCRRLAEEEGVNFQGYWLDAPLSTLRERLATRRNDASDAGVEVLEKQLDYDKGGVDWQKVETSGP